jgi:hypothetical protein
LSRDVDSSGESIREMDSMAEMGDEFYQQSGVLYKLVGVLRAADIFWNPEKRQVLNSSHKIFRIRNDLNPDPKEIISDLRHCIHKCFGSGFGFNQVSRSRTGIRIRSQEVKNDPKKYEKVKLHILKR